jgi:D-tyrosyl-tRNA(Tyr) deacylase
VRAVLQRVTRAEVVVDGEPTGSIGSGLCVLVGVAQGDTEDDAEWLAEKTLAARVFLDDDGKMNRSLVDVRGAILAISQFTLLGDLRKGRRPSFSQAMEPTEAARLFEHYCSSCRQGGVSVEQGRFRAHMEVEIHNSGPVTLLVDSKRQF